MADFSSLSAPLCQDLSVYPLPLYYNRPLLIIKSLLPSSLFYSFSCYFQGFSEFHPVPSVPHNMTLHIFRNFQALHAEFWAHLRVAPRRGKHASTPHPVPRFQHKAKKRHGSCFLQKHEGRRCLPPPATARRAKKATHLDDQEKKNPLLLIPESRCNFVLFLEDFERKCAIAIKRSYMSVSLKLGATHGNRLETICRTFSEQEGMRNI